MFQIPVSTPLWTPILQKLRAVGEGRRAHGKALPAFQPSELRRKALVQAQGQFSMSPPNFLQRKIPGGFGGGRVLR